MFSLRPLFRSSQLTTAARRTLHYTAPALNTSTRPESPVTPVPTVQDGTVPTEYELANGPQADLVSGAPGTSTPSVLRGIDKSHLTYDALTYRVTLADNLHLSAFPHLREPQPSSSTDRSVSSVPQKTLCNLPRARRSDG